MASVTQWRKVVASIALGNGLSEIGSATLSLDEIGRIGVAVVKVRCGSRSNVAAGGEAEDADTLRINLPCSGVVAGQADGALGVE